MTLHDLKNNSKTFVVNRSRHLKKSIVIERSLTFFLFSLSLFLLSSCARESSPDATQAPTQNAPDLAEINDYIVVLKSNPSENKLSAQDVKSLVVSSLGQIEKAHQLDAATKVFTTALRGGVYRMTGEQAQALAQRSNVAYVEKDQHISLRQAGVATDLVQDVLQSQVQVSNSVQNNPTWGLDRIDQLSLPLDRRYNMTADGTGVRAYVIDTGILNTHQEFQGRAVSGFDAVDGDADATDCNGHGTHVAGTIGGKTYGVAKNVQLVGVRVLDCGGSGTYSGVIAGVDWVTANHIKPAVANMSLGGPVSQALEDAIANSIRAGVVYVVAAGNDNRSACQASPARLRDAITVGSSTREDVRSSFSNFGECVDVFAPGSDIESAWDTSDTAVNTISGTSMASPHVAGVVANYLQTRTTHAQSQVESALIAGSSVGKLSSVGSGSPNRLLNTAFLGSAPQPPPPPVNENELRNGVSTAALAGAKNSERFFTVTVPAGAKNLMVELSGGSPDADLYMKFDSRPSTSSFDCRPYLALNNERCAVAAPKAGVYHVMVRGYTKFSGAILKASYNQ